MSVGFILTLFLNHLMPYNSVVNVCTCNNVWKNENKCEEYINALVISCRRDNMYLRVLLSSLRKPFIRKIVYGKNILLPYMHILLFLNQNYIKDLT